MNMETGGFGGDDRRRLLVPALIVVAALVVLLLIIGIASAIRSRSAAAPTATVAAVATTRPPIVAGSATVATRTVVASTAPRQSTAPSTAPSTPPSTPPGASTAYVIANTGGDNINLRRTASTSAEIVARLAEGDRVTEIGPVQTVEGREWRNIRTSDGIDGWVASEFTQKAP